MSNSKNFYRYLSPTTLLSYAEVIAFFAIASDLPIANGNRWPLLLCLTYIILATWIASTLQKAVFGSRENLKNNAPYTPTPEDRKSARLALIISVAASLVFALFLTSLSHPWGLLFPVIKVILAVRVDQNCFPKTN